MSGFALTTTGTANVVAAYTSPLTVIQAALGWVVVGQFRVSRTVTGRLDCQGVVSGPGLTLQVRMWDVQEDEAVTTLGGANTTSLLPIRFLGAQGTMQGGRDYQLQARVLGSALETDFGILLTGTVS